MPARLIAASFDWFMPWEWTHDDAIELREWLIAIGTVGAVIVALSLARRAERLAKRRRPRLDLVWSHIFGTTVEAVTYFNHTGAIGSGKATYLRFNVANDHGKDAAEDVELLLWKVTGHPDGPDGWGQLLDISFPGLAWTHVGSTRLTLGAGVVRTVDVARAYDDPPDAELRDVIELAIEPAPADGRHRLKPGTYDLELTLSARNADAQFYWTRIRYDPKAEPYSRIEVLSEPKVGGSPLAYE